MYGSTDSNLFRHTRVLLVCLLILTTGKYAQSQSLPDTTAADLAKISVLSDISAGTYVYFAPTKGPIPKNQLPFLPFKIHGTKKYEHFIPAPLVNNKAILKFTLINSSEEEESVFLCPGFYYDSIQVFKWNGKAAGASQVERLPAILPNDADSLGYRKISLSPHGEGTYFVALTFIKTATNSINPTLTRDTLIRQGIVLNHKSKTSVDIVTNLFAGIMLMMI